MLCFLLLVLGGRAIVPAGYMPDASSGRRGALAVELCTVNNKLTKLLLAFDTQTDDSSPATADDAACAFGLLSLQAATLPPQAERVFFAMLVHAPPRVTAVDVVVAATATVGPPLGSRAPPLA